ncbi:hypothetical protein B0T16DRAFT_392908 [Cercophora newfieldiana]|uniref:Uncharacterized protein n=1 Tax=Cercophora newfieldiana TaxID=92897 RepID=A0AA39Y231_9PEZI|nr:hypothetical protein B0T16DRAFT_392908 [Cercophora newfieldiana]
MCLNALAAVTIAILVGVSPVTSATVGKTTDADVKRDSTPCPTCHLTRRSDGTIAIIDRAAHETLGRAILYDEALAELSKRDTSVLIKPETRIFAKRDACEGVREWVQYDGEVPSGDAGDVYEV